MGKNKIPFKTPVSPFNYENRKSNGVKYPNSVNSMSSNKTKRENDYQRLSCSNGSSIRVGFNNNTGTGLAQSGKNNYKKIAPHPNIVMTPELVHH